MVEIGKTLYELQQIDLTLRKNRKRLQEIEAQLANHAPVQKAKKRLALAEEKLKPLQTELRDLELQVQSTKQKRESSEKRLYSGTVSNPKELQDIEQNIASLKRWQSELEDKQLELMMAIESAEETLTSAQGTLDSVMAESVASNTDLSSEKERLISEMTDLNANRDNIRSQLDTENLNLYDEMQAKMAFLPIATLGEEYHCSICGVQQTSLHAQQIKQSNDLLRCASCNRILLAI